MPKHPRATRLLKTCGVLGFSTVLGLSAYESIKCYNALRKPLNSNVMIDKRQFIYIKHDHFREPMNDFLNEIFVYEPDFYSKIKGLYTNFMKKFTLTKLEFALKTLNIAKYSTDPYLRLKALKNLAALKDLDDWEFQYLAQHCDAKTATSLARLNCNTKWFIKPREYNRIVKSKYEIITEIKEMLNSLSHHECVEHVLDTIFAYDKVKDPDDETFSYGGITRQENDLIIQSMDALLHLTTKKELCKEIAKNNGLELLLAIYKHFDHNMNVKLILNKIVSNMTSCHTISDEFYKSGWIYLLSHWQNHEDLRIQVLASTALSNLDRDDPYAFSYPTKVYPLYPRGKYHKKPEMDVVFVHGILGGIFITWRQQRENDKAPTPSSPKKNGKNGNGAKKVDLDQKLNFDENNPDLHNSFYEEEALFEHEKMVKMHHSEPSRKLHSISDQVTKEILEGLIGDDDIKSSDTDILLTKKMRTFFRKKFHKDDEYTFCFPLDWLPADFPDIRILGLNYETALSVWVSTACPCEKLSRNLLQRSIEFLDKLAEARVGKDRPVVWVGHSMGGLIIKYIINLALTSDNPKVRQIGENSRGIMFLGTPHKGSSMAKLSTQTAILWPTIEVKELEEKSSQLTKLHDEFLENMQKLTKPIKIISIAEGNTTKIVGMNLQIVPIDSAFMGLGNFYVSSENHLNLSKPVTKESFLYTKIVKMIDQILNDDRKNK